MALTSDDKFLISCSRQNSDDGSGDRSFKIFDFETKRQILEQSHESDTVTSMTLTPDDKFIIFGSWDGKILKTITPSSKEKSSPDPAIFNQKFCFSKKN